MLEYVSKGSKRKDYVDNMRNYEHELKVPYYLLFDPKKKKQNLFRHTGNAFVPVEPDEHGRLAIKKRLLYETQLGAPVDSTTLIRRP
jgi:Uma2 family endonuclease